MKATKDLHVAEVKIRLTEDDAKMLELLSRKADIPRAVLARNLFLRSFNAVLNDEVEHRISAA